MPLGGASNLLLLKHRCLRSGDVTPDVPRGCFTDSPTEEGALDSAAGRGGGNIGTWNYLPKPRRVEGRKLLGFE